MENPSEASCKRPAGANLAACTHCRGCVSKCEVLADVGADIGDFERALEGILAAPEDDRDEALFEWVSDNYEMYHALRRCCFCGHCTSKCPAGRLAAGSMRAWRELFSHANLMPPEASRIVMVDERWHVFSVYRDHYGVSYPDLPMLEDVAAGSSEKIDAVFFPGCTLASYTPELVRDVGAWLDGCGVKWALSIDCCGSPLMSAGLFERAAALRQRIVDQTLAAGATSLITVCPGCGEELAATAGDALDIVPLPEMILERVRNAGSAEAAGLSPARLSSYSLFDSCHDRADNRHGTALRSVLGECLPDGELRELAHTGRNALCCGAGGAVGSYDADITARRVARVLGEAREARGDVLLSACPTCTYTIAQANLGLPEGERIDSRNYLEVLFDRETDWGQIFANLGAMWTGEYGAWLNELFYS